ncbi:TonB-dependent receptor family protein [Flavobacterium sp.]|jgi:Fe(3+) dicitrate transport protein|uniref:TonB-dependent receptor family protein n=1 Tax=Flavobacterium sp. TaxID=239 RepID=UPI0037C160DA
MKKVVTLAFISMSILGFSQEKEVKKDTISTLSEVIVNSDAIVGNKFKAKNKAGSTFYLSEADLKVFRQDDISRVLINVPGVTIQESDGFGLRPSIGMRGTNPDRSSKITLMEDGVLIAPAPYSAPAAYYFPTAARMKAFEIIKGGSQIQYGPYTTAGALNMVSTQIPSNFSGNVTATYGSYNTKHFYTSIGDSFKNFGYLVEYNNRNSDGFMDIDYSSKDTGFDANDYIAKFRLNTDFDAKVYQSLTLKLQYSEDASHETYLGLTDTDYKANPYRRYLGSNEDNLITDHFQMMATHYIRPIQNLTFTTKAYRNTFARNWYKLDAVNLGTSSVSIKNIIEDPVKYSAEYNAIAGNNNTVANALRVKANNRNYEAQGVQTVGNYNFNTGKIKHDLEFGVRYHEDYEDRYQWVDGYAITNKFMNQTNNGLGGSDANRIQSAKALASHILYNLTIDKLTLTPGLRNENIIVTNNDYGISDPNRIGANLKTTENKVNVWIPGLGLLYNFNDNYKLFASLHKGFSPAGALSGEDAENSINSEIGFRMNKNAFATEIVIYNNEYSNLQGADTMSGGGSGTGDLFNAGNATVNGLEFTASYDVLNKSTAFRLPIALSYTYTNTELKSDFVSPSWGTVKNGDEIPFIPKNQLALMADLEHKKFSFAANARFIGEFRTKAGQGEIPANYKIDDNIIIDLAAKYHLTNKVSLTSNVINLLDSDKGVARTPAGLRPSHPFGINAGIIARF